MQFVSCNVSRMLCATVLALFATTADAAPHPADAFGGQVLVADKPFPMSADSKAKYIKQLQKQRTRRIAENKETKQWKLFYAGFFKKPLNDLEVTVKIYDITEGKRMLTSFEQYLGKKGERVFHSSVVLERAQLEPNRRILMEVVNKGRILAQGDVTLVGEVDRPSGEVDFTKD